LKIKNGERETKSQRVFKKRQLKNKISYVLITCVIFASLMGCSGSSANEKEDKLGADVSNVAEQEDSQKDGQGDYSEYIKNAIDTVSKDAITPTPVPEDDGLGQIITVPSSENDSIYISASEQLPEDSGITPVFGNEDTDTTSEEDDKAKEDEAKEEEPAELTPDTFDVGTCCIYINGEIDESYGSDIVKAINKARTDLGYEAMTEKEGLDTCANRRTREIAAHFGHMRPNGTAFYSLAPQYFKAEMLAIDGAKASETVDAWIRDPVSRSLIFSTKYSSVGAACFKCNGLNCVVVAFGY